METACCFVDYESAILVRKTVTAERQWRPQCLYTTRTRQFGPKDRHSRKAMETLRRWHRLTSWSRVRKTVTAERQWRLLADQAELESERVSERPSQPKGNGDTVCPFSLPKPFPVRKTVTAERQWRLIVICCSLLWIHWVRKTVTAERQWRRGSSVVPSDTHHAVRKTVTAERQWRPINESLESFSVTRVRKTVTAERLRAVELLSDAPPNSVIRG